MSNKRSRVRPNYKTLIGARLRAWDPEGQQVEALLACNALNRMTARRRPESFPTGR